jgi:hypothetical protein
LRLAQLGKGQTQDYNKSTKKPAHTKPHFLLTQPEFNFAALAPPFVAPLGSGTAANNSIGTDEGKTLGNISELQLNYK